MMDHKTELTLTEKKLKESEEKFRRIFETIPDLFFLVSSDTTVLDYKGNIDDLYTPPEQFLGKKIIDLLPKDIGELSLNSIKKTLDTQKPQIVEYILNIQGKDRFFEARHLYFTEDRVLIFIRDITKRKVAEDKLKKSEEKYRLLFENMTAAFAYHKVIVDKNNKPINYKYIEANPMFEKLTGIKIDELIGKTITEILPGIENEPADWIGKFGNVGLTGIPLTVEDYSETIKKWFKVSGYSPKKGYFAVTFTDITARKNAEEKLKKSEEDYRKAYARANLYRDLFAHDMNNILQNIRSSTELSSIYLNDPEKLKTIKELNAIIEDQVSRGVKLIKNVQKLSLIEETEISLEPIDIKEILKEAIQFLKNSYQTRIIEIQVDSIREKIIAQANILLLDAFENLLINAVRHNNNPKVEINVKISEDHSDGRNYIKIEFIDNGTGISDIRKKIIFQRVLEKHKKHKGMGLGLSLVKKIIEYYNGHIWVEDRVQGDYTKGSNFVLLIPKTD